MTAVDTLSVHLPVSVHVHVYVFADVSRIRTLFTPSSVLKIRKNIARTCLIRLNNVFTAMEGFEAINGLIFT